MKALKPLRAGSAGRKVWVFSHTVPAVQDGQGDLYPDAKAFADAWVAHFAGIEGGTAVPPTLIAEVIAEERRNIEKRVRMSLFRTFPHASRSSLLFGKPRDDLLRVRMELVTYYYSHEHGSQSKSLHSQSKLLSQCRPHYSPEEASSSSSARARVPKPLSISASPSSWRIV